MQLRYDEEKLLGFDEQPHQGLVRDVKTLRSQYQLRSQFSGTMEYKLFLLSHCRCISIQLPHTECSILIHILSQLEIIAQTEASLIFPHFTIDDAWTLGTALRTRLLPFPKPVVIHIASANSGNVLFHTATKAGIAPDNDIWVARKLKTVLRFGCSTYYMRTKLGADEQLFASKYGLGEKAGDYAIHGGAIPIKVKGVDGVVAVVIVSGLKQEEDHEVIVETIQELLPTL